MSRIDKQGYITFPSFVPVSRGRAAGQHHRARVGSRARRHDAGREARTAD